MRTIIVDDEPYLLELTKSLLELNGHFEVLETFQNPLTALKAIEHLKPELCCVDVCMPQLSGYELVLEIKRILPETKIMLISSALPNEFLIHEHKINGYISKPLNKAKVSKMLAMLQDTKGLGAKP